MHRVIRNGLMPASNNAQLTHARPVSLQNLSRLMEERVATETNRIRVPADCTAERAFSPFDAARFGHLSEPEILARIGALLASAMIRSGRLGRPTTQRPIGATSAAAPVVDALEMVRDPMARMVARYLRISGPATPVAIAFALGIKRRTLARKLHLLRAGGLCVVTGRTRTARYGLRTDFAAN